MRILIVDDYSTMRRIVRSLLEQIGYQDVDDAEDGRSALEKLRNAPYDLVISDWNMEPMTGLELLNEMRADEKLKATPFMLVTAEGKVENVVAAKKAGVDSYIVKPFTAQTLKAKINALMPGKAA